MRQAQKEGRLYREQPFVMGYPARDLFDERRKKGGKMPVVFFLTE